MAVPAEFSPQTPDSERDAALSFSQNKQSPITDSASPVTLNITEQPVGRPDSPTALTHRLAQKFAPDAPLTVSQPPEPSAISQALSTGVHAARERLPRMTRRRFLATTGVLFVATPAAAIAAGVDPRPGVRAAETPKPTETANDLDTRYYRVVQHVLDDAFGGELAPVLAQEAGTHFPDIKTFTQNKQRPDSKAAVTYPSWVMDFGLKDRPANGPVAKLAVTTYFDPEVPPSEHSMGTLRKVVVEGNVAQLFGGTTPEHVIRAIIRDAHTFDIKPGTTGPTGLPVRDRESIPAIIATQESFGEPTTKVSVNDLLKLRYDRSYNKPESEE